MGYQVPQFINIESKVVGPLTLKQFVWVGLGGAILLMLLKVLPTIWFIVIAIPVGGLFAALAFYKIDGMPLIQYIMNMLSYALGNKKYIFKK